MIDHFQRLIGQILRIGVYIAFFSVLTGGVLYLSQHGFELVQWKLYQTPPHDLKTVSDTFSAAFELSSLGLIQFGLLFLVLTQLLRVGVTAWMFYKYREMILFFVSGFIFFIILYSLFFL